MKENSYKFTPHIHALTHTKLSKQIRGQSQEYKY